MTIRTLAEDVCRRYARRWKPGTLAVNRSYLRRQILPRLGDVRVADLTRADVQRWFDSLSATPAAANRSLPILSIICREAESAGHRPPDSNPCPGLRHYRTPGRERFLTRAELGRLGAALAAREAAAPVPVAAVRLLVLTGCRQGEVRTLLWADYRERRLFLRDSKTGPRTVWLSAAARGVLDALPRASRWILPAGRSAGHLPVDTLAAHWARIRAAAGLPGVRLHDLRHTFASFALRQGETVLTTGRLLGHRDPATTLKYAHCADAAARAAVETLGGVLGPAVEVDHAPIQ